MSKGTIAVSPSPRETNTMNRLNDEPRGTGLDNWVERTCSYLRSRTADHWLMFAAGLLLGAVLG